MKIILISTYAHPVALGLRYISSYLKTAGYEVEMIFMSSKRDTAEAVFPAPAMEAFIDKCRSADLMGMSLMTNSFNRARVLTKALRDSGNKAPIVWGGVHPTVAPDESLEIADMICVGEGEEPMRLLADRLREGRDPRDVPNIGFRAGGPFGNMHTIKNPVMPLMDVLDDLPFCDYELHTHWVIDKGMLKPARPNNLRGTLHRFRIETTRGCPFKCNFCNNTTWQNIYKNKGQWVRKRSNDNVIAELEKAIKCFPGIEEINILDDLFFVRNEEEMRDFAEKYRQKINIPVELDAHPNLITEGKLAALENVPISLLSMGIQSGSPDTLKNIYGRNTPIKKIIEGINLLHDRGINAEYHYLINNHYEPDKNIIETMHFVADHHKGPAVLRIFPLMFYPGSPLYERACKDGVIGKRHEAAYNFTYTGKTQFAMHDYLSTWLRIVLHMRNVGIPGWITHRVISLVANRYVRWCIDRKSFTAIVFKGYQLFRKVYKNLIYKPFIRPIVLLQRKLRHNKKRDKAAILDYDKLAATDTRRHAHRKQITETDGQSQAWTLPESRRHKEKVAP